MGFARGFSFLAGLLALASLPALANHPSPLCASDSGQNIPIINQQVLEWKEGGAPLGEPFRAHVIGTIGRIFADQSGHMHYAIHLTNAAPVPGCQPNAETDCLHPADLLEVVYNLPFGPTPNPTIGMNVEACGDYITANAPYNGYQPSPAGAIIHWIHMSPEPQQHPSGYLIMNGALCGQHNPPPGSNPDYRF